MPGAFPGMNPFLENHWGDVHTSLMVYTANSLRPQLPTGFRAWIEERITELEDEPPDALYRSDPLTERTVYVSDGFCGRVVTSIEFLSSHNKLTERARELFRRKQELMLAGGVNIVEIDLVRQGGWVMSVREPARPQAWSYPYRVCVIRAIRKSLAERYSLPLQERLPVIRIPLRPDDRDATLDLQSLIDAAWRDGGCDDFDRIRDPLPPFVDADVEWIRQRMAEAAPQQQATGR